MRVADWSHVGTHLDGRRKALKLTPESFRPTVLTYGVELNLPRRFQPLEMLVSGKNSQTISPCRGNDNSVGQLHPVFLPGLYNELRKDWVIRWDVEHIGNVAKLGMV